MAKKSLNDDKLIGLVQARTVIYDKTDRFYTSKSHNRDAWKQIAAEMNTTVMACQKRWRYLRDYFVRQLHTHPSDRLTTIDSVMNGNGKKKSLWSSFERLKFLAPFSSTRRGRSKMEENYDYIIEIPSQRPQTDELNSTNSQSSNNSVQTSYDMNNVQWLQYQQQFGDYFRTSSSKDVDNSPSEASDQLVVVDVDQYTDDDDDDVLETHVVVTDDQPCEEEDTIVDNRPSQPVVNSLEDRTSSPVGTMKQLQKRRNSEAYDDLMEFLRTKRYETDCDEHEHFFKSLLASVRKIDENHIMSFRTDIMQIVSKYLYMSQSENMMPVREDPANVVVIETDKLHWRKNLRKYNRI